MSLNEMHIRHVEPPDIAQIWPIIKDNSDNGEAAFFNRVVAKRLLEDHFIPVTLLEEKVIGYAWVHDYGPHIRVGHRTARLNDLFVLPHYQRLGVGTQLFSSVKEWCQARNVKWLQWQSSKNAVPFYERQGLKGDPCPDPGHPFFEIEF